MKNELRTNAIVDQIKDFFLGSRTHYLRKDRNSMPDIFCEPKNLHFKTIIIY